MIKSADLVSKFQLALRDKWGYIFGSSGQLWTAKNQAETTNTMAQEYGSKWIGHRVADCSGLFSWAADKLGGYLPHGSNSLYRKYCTSKGQIKSVSDLMPGMAVFKVRSGTKYSDKLDWYHIGLYVGDGKVIEAKSTQRGVVQSKVKEWHSWGMLKGVSYIMEVIPVVDKTGKAVVDTPNDGTVRVRKRPGIDGPVVTTLPEGTEVTIEEISGEWCKVTYTGSGYIMKKFLAGR